MNPEIKVRTGFYEFTWADKKLKIKVSRVRAHKDGRVTGEILITSGADLIHRPTSINFTANRSINELIKTLEDGYTGYEWHTIITELTYYVLEKSREGEPVRELTTVGEVKPPEYLLRPFIIRNYPTIIFGERSTTKSTLGLLLMTSLLLPWHDNPLNLTVPTRSVKSLLLDWETDEQTIKWQLKCFQTGMELPEFAINYRRCSLPLADDLEQIHNNIESTKAEVLFIDSMGPAVGGGLKEDLQAINFYNALRQLNTTAVIMAHTSKDRDAKVKTVFGSIFFENLARSIWEVRKFQEPSESELNISLYHRKPPPFESASKPLGFKFTFNGTGTQIFQQDPRTIAEFLEGMSISTRIYEQLRIDAQSTKELVDTLQIKRGTADGLLKRMRDKGQITKKEDLWYLTYKED